jgi:hypothetical protein
MIRLHGTVDNKKFKMVRRHVVLADVGKGEV